MELFEQANQLHLEKKYDEAEKLYDRLLTQNPDNPGLLATMGTLYLQTDRLGLAISLLKRSSEKKPDSEVLCNLGIAYKYSGQYEKCHKYFEKAVKSKPSADALANYAGLFINIGTPEKAAEAAKKALKLNQSNAMAHWNLAMAQLEMGKWDTAWDEHEWGFGVMRKDRELGGKPRWNGEPGTVAVYGEQGLGDEIMFASMLPDLQKTNKVILECHPRLLTLFQRSFPDIKCHGTRTAEQVEWSDHYDYQISIGSLGKFYRRTADSFPGTPYLSVEDQPKGKFRVGISWTGGMKQGRIKTRSIPLSWWKSILNNDCEFVSLQYTEAEPDLKLMDDLGYAIKRNDAVFAQDYYETAKLVKSCDLVISVCTSVIHLAGAMGVSTWVMVPNKPAWRYGVKGRMPWYSSVRLYRQPPGDTQAWMPVVEKVGYDLSELLHSK